MKKILISVALISVCLSLSLKLESSLTVDDSYQLSCDGAYGNVQYQVHNLPQGVILQDDTIKIQNERLLKEGPVTLRVSAKDERGFTDERIIVIIFKRKAHQMNENIEETIVAQENTDVKVNEVLDGLLVPTDVEGNYQYPENGYPTVDFPQGANTGIPNFTPTQIAKTKAIRSEANRNTITSDDVKATAIFQRQLNAAKAIANLLSIVKQATANRNAAKEEIQKRTSLYEQAKQATREAEETIIKAENTLARVKQGIEATNKRINEIRAEIDSLVSLKNKKEAERSSIREGIKSAQSNLRGVNREIQSQQEQLSNAQIDLDDKKFQCEALDDQISSVSDSLSERRLQRASLGVKINSAENKVSDDRANVEDLKRRLAQAENSLKSSINELNSLNAEAGNLDETISKTESTLRDLQGRAQGCQADLQIIQARVDNLKNKILPDLEIKKLQIENEIKRLGDVEASLSGELEEIPKKIGELQEQEPEYLEKLRVLRSQVFVFESKLRAAYDAGNAANNHALQAKENLDAANQKFIDENNIIQEATHNIELARIQKSQADRAVQNYLMEGADILPFAAAPGESGFEALGAGKYAIKSWEEYVEIAFGKGVKPLFIGDLQSLYSFKTKEGEGEADEKECASENQRSISGYIIQVFSDRISVINDQGELFDISYADCTMALANVESYEFANGDIVVLKGVQEGHHIKATQLTTIRR